MSAAMKDAAAYSWQGAGLKLKPTAPTTKAAGAWVAEAEAAMREAPSDTPHRRLLIDCERLHCRWPIDGFGADLMACGDATRKNSPYCPAHHARAYVPPPWRTASVGGVVRKVAGVVN